MRIDFDWDPAKAASNAAKHGVTFENARTIFRDPGSPEEERWVTIGEAVTGSLLVVVHTWVDSDPDRSMVRVISARRPTRNEARQ